MNVQQEYKILSFSISETKMKKIMGNLTLNALDTNEIVSAKLWEEDLNKYEKKFFKPHNIIYVEDGTYSEQYKNLIIKKMSLVEEAASGLNEEKRELMYQELLGVATELKNEDYKTAIIKMLEEHEALLKNSPRCKKQPSQLRWWTFEAHSRMYRNS